MHYVRHKCKGCANGIVFSQYIAFGIGNRRGVLLYLCNKTRELTMTFNYENFEALQRENSKLQKENSKLQKALNEMLTLFNFDKSAQLSIDDIAKSDYLTELSKDYFIQPLGNTAIVRSLN